MLVHQTLNFADIHILRVRQYTRLFVPHPDSRYSGRPYDACTMSGSDIPAGKMEAGSLSTMRGDVDEAELARMGYKQELK